MYLRKVLIRFQHDLFSIHIPFTTIQIFDAGIPDMNHMNLGGNNKINGNIPSELNDMTALTSL
jgi:hypothetical protein